MLQNLIRQAETKAGTQKALAKKNGCALSSFWRLQSRTANP